MIGLSNSVIVASSLGFVGSILSVEVSEEVSDVIWFDVLSSLGVVDSILSVEASGEVSDVVWFNVLSSLEESSEVDAGKALSNGVYKKQYTTEHFRR